MTKPLHKLAIRVSGKITIKTEGQTGAGEKYVYQRVAKNKGNLGNLGKYGLQLRKELPRNDRKSPRQLILRERKASGTALWKSLPKSERDRWKGLAANLRMNSFNLFMQHFMRGEFMTTYTISLATIVMPQSGQWLCPQGFKREVNLSGVPPANRILFTRIGVSKTTSIDGIGHHIFQSGMDYCQYKMGLYSANSNGLPGQLLYASETFLSTDAGAAISEISPVITMQPGVYYTAFIRGDSENNFVLFTCFAQDTVTELPNSSIDSTDGVLSQSNAFSNTATDLPFTASATIYPANLDMPVIKLRAA